MKKTLKFMITIALVAGAASVRAQDELTEADDWSFSVDYAHKSYIFQHDALQQRVDHDSDFSEDWRDGDTEGFGGGFMFTARRGMGRGTVRIIASDYEYERLVDTGSHEVDTTRRDMDIYWTQHTGQNEHSLWGWNLGFRYVGMNKKVVTWEEDTLRTWKGDNQWYMVMAGYQGETWLFGREYFNVHGNLNVLFGESTGLARMGEDESFDGTIEVDYEDKYSLAYGINGSIGLGFRLTNRFSVGVDYQREWLYSFKATDEGVVVFPDNHDALFTEVNHNAYAYLGVTW